MKELTIIGNIGQSATLKVVNSRTFINFSVAVNESYKTAEGTKVEKTTWIDCFKVVNDGRSTRVVDYLKKGTQVMVRGDVDINLYTNRSGQAAASLKLKIEKLQLLGSKSETATPQAQPQQPATQAADPDPFGKDSEPDDLPF